MTWSGLRPFLSRCLVQDECVVRDVKYCWSSLKMLLKLASKCWDFDLNEICCCAFSVWWPKMVLVLHLLRSFLIYFVWTSPGAFDCLKVDVLNFVYIPGCVWNFMSGFPQWIVKDLLTAMYESCASYSIFQRKSIHKTLLKLTLTKL